MDLFRNRGVIYFLMFYKFKCSHFFQILLGIQGGIPFSFSHESLFSAALVAAVGFLCGRTCAGLQLELYTLFNDIKTPRFWGI